MTRKRKRLLPVLTTADELANTQVWTGLIVCAVVLAWIVYDLIWGYGY